MSFNEWKKQTSHRAASLDKLFLIERGLRRMVRVLVLVPRETKTPKTKGKERPATNYGQSRLVQANFPRDAF